MRSADLQVRIMSGPGGPRSMATSDKDRIRDGPGNLSPLADGASADGGARGLLQDHRRAVAGPQHVAAPFPGPDGFGAGDAPPALRCRPVPGPLRAARPL